MWSMYTCISIIFHISFFNAHIRADSNQPIIRWIFSNVFFQTRYTPRSDINQSATQISTHPDQWINQSMRRSDRNEPSALQKSHEIFAMFLQIGIYNMQIWTVVSDASRVPFSWLRLRWLWHILLAFIHQGWFESHPLLSRWCVVGVLPLPRWS